MKEVLLGILVLIFLSCGTNRHEGTQKNKIKKYNDITGVYPLANGTALAAGNNEQGDEVLFLVAGNQASIVSGVPKDAFGMDIYPLADGSAYIVFPDSDFNSWVYHLEGTSLIKVNEVKQLTSHGNSVSHAGFLWATLVSENTRNARKKADEEAAESAASDARSNVN